MTEQEFRQKLADLQDTLNEMIDGAFAIGKLGSLEVQQVLLEMLRDEIERLLKEVRGGSSK